uniref:GP-PDE domain-containing protein n=1 Tax=Panagrolaimus superbus TaxID=310955 RepID=A0A914YFR6_9BILA
MYMEFCNLTLSFVPTFVQQQKSAGRHVCAWTVNDLTEMNWMRQTLSIPVLTDKPFLIDQMKGHGKKI